MEGELEWYVAFGCSISLSGFVMPGSRRGAELKCFPTKATPVYATKFSRRNMLIAAGVFMPDQVELAE